MRAIFFGTPALAVPSLDALARIADVPCVICQPDRPAGRGMALRPPPVKQRALELGIEVMQPEKVRTPDFAASLRALRADVAVVIAYGRILPRGVLEAPARGCVNIHASLLPRWRGAGPIQWAIISGDARTGVSLMQMDEGMDTGPVIATRATDIDPDEDASALGARLSRMGAELLESELARYVAGEIAPTPQDETLACAAPLLEKEDGRLDFRAGAREVHARVRGVTPWPGAFTTDAGRVVKIHRTRVAEDGGTLGAPGEILRADADGIVVACGEGAIRVEELQLDSKKRLRAAPFLAGQGWSPGRRLGEP
ncbi:MAG: methionyl-tRNA formyltransferase [Sandaracinaceae bacterium]